MKKLEPIQSICQMCGNTFAKKRWEKKIFCTKACADQHIRTYKKEMGDVAGAQTIILDELAKEFGGSAEAAGQTFAGQLDILKNSLDNVAEGVGMALLPILQDLMDNVITPLIPLIEMLALTFTSMFEGLAQGDPGVAFDALREGIFGIGSELGISKEALQGFNLKLTEIWDWINTDGKQYLEDFQTKLAEFGAWLQGDGKAAWDNFMLSLQPLIDGFVNLATTIQNDFPLMQAKAEEFVAWATTEFGPPLVTMIETIKTAFSRLVVLSGDDLNTMATFWNTHKETIMTIVSVAFQFITVTIGGALTLISGLLASALLLMQGDWSLAWDTMKTTLETFMNLALGIVGTNLEEFNTVWSTNWDNLKLIWDTFWTNFIATWQTDWEMFQTIVSTIIDNVMLFFVELKKTINSVIITVQSLINKILSIPGIPGEGSSTNGSGTGNVNNQTAGGFAGNPESDTLLAQGDLLGAMLAGRGGGGKSGTNKTQGRPTGGGKGGVSMPNGNFAVASEDGTTYAETVMINAVNVILNTGKEGASPNFSMFAQMATG